MNESRKERVWSLTEKGCALLALYESGFLPESKDGKLNSTETKAQFERFWKLFTARRARAE